MTIPRLNYARLKELLRYDAETGEFRWTSAPGVQARMKGKRQLHEGCTL